MASNLEQKIDTIYYELIKKFEALSWHIKRLDSQVAQNAISIRREQGLLPGRTGVNPRRQVSAVILGSCKRLTPNLKESITLVNLLKSRKSERVNLKKSRWMISNRPRSSDVHRL